MLRWIIELGSIYISFEVSALSRYLEFPRTQQLVQPLHIFKHPEINNANDLAFDTCYQRVTSDQDTQIKVQAMKDLYVDSGEEIPPNAPKPRRKPVQANCFVYSDHTGYRATRQISNRDSLIL